MKILLGKNEKETKNFCTKKMLYILGTTEEGLQEVV